MTEAWGGESTWVLAGCAGLAVILQMGLIMGLGALLGEPRSSLSASPLLVTLENPPVPSALSPSVPVIAEAVSHLARPMPDGAPLVESASPPPSPAPPLPPTSPVVEQAPPQGNPQRQLSVQLPANPPMPPRRRPAVAAKTPASPRSERPAPPPVRRSALPTSSQPAPALAPKEEDRPQDGSAFSSDLEEALARWRHRRETRLAGGPTAPIEPSGRAAPGKSGEPPANLSGQGAASVSTKASFEAYLSAVRREIERHKRYPAAARERGLAGKVVVVFSIDGAGLVNNAAIEGGGGDPLSQAALALVAGRRFATPPPGWDPAARIRMPIVFSLH